MLRCVFFLYCFLLVTFFSSRRVLVCAGAYLSSSYPLMPDCQYWVYFAFLRCFSFCTFLFCIFWGHKRHWLVLWHISALIFFFVLSLQARRWGLSGCFAAFLFCPIPLLALRVTKFKACCIVASLSDSMLILRSCQLLDTFPVLPSLPFTPRLCFFPSCLHVHIVEREQSTMMAMSSCEVGST
ncbi:hypothetical protein BDY21DRAFT_176536 [Lineolata rhizophorae]|uniref:Uncharacterized protein n=1 Tax=Lineolata rhizophorae TaxID=578093 RepID=A0A6A6P8C8_9PEZI|nr:hypothetical protein BDY21DRAFT_176536 [Lineolata rhizophorae]